MIFSAMQHEDPDWMYTIVEINGKYVKVGLTAEELFRHALGDEEFDRRRDQAYADDWGGPPPPPPDPPKISEVDDPSNRFIDKEGITKWQSS